MRQQLSKSPAMGAVDWKMTASAAALSGILSLLTSVAGLPENEAGEQPSGEVTEMDPAVRLMGNEKE